MFHNLDQFDLSDQLKMTDEQKEDGNMKESEENPKDRVCPPRYFWKEKYVPQYSRPFETSFGKDT